MSYEAVDPAFACIPSATPLRAGRRGLARLAWLFAAWPGMACGTGSPLAVPPDAAVQTICREGVPHTTRKGELPTTFDEARSFLPIGIWGAPRPETVEGVRYDWSQLRAAGFNTVWPWPYDTEQELDDAAADPGQGGGRPFLPGIAAPKRAAGARARIRSPR